MKKNFIKKVYAAAFAVAMMYVVSNSVGVFVTAILGYAAYFFGAWAYDQLSNTEE